MVYYCFTHINHIQAVFHSCVGFPDSSQQGGILFANSDWKQQQEGGFWTSKIWIQPLTSGVLSNTIGIRQPEHVDLHGFTKDNEEFKRVFTKKQTGFKMV